MRSSSWVWFFALLAVAGAAAMATPFWYNLRQQLTPDELAAHRALWREHGPHDYDLDYVVRLDEATRGEECQVSVRGGRVASATCGGAPEREPLTIDGLFALMGAALAEDAATGRRNYTVAHFDPADGHPRRYVRRVKARGERTEIVVRLRPAP
jgi:hypothetical protein